MSEAILNPRRPRRSSRSRRPRPSPTSSSGSAASLPTASASTPAPGTATEADGNRPGRASENRLCELIDGVLVEKTMGFTESRCAAELIMDLGNYLRTNDLGLIAGADGMLRLQFRRVRIPDVAFIAQAPHRRPEGPGAADPRPRPRPRRGDPQREQHREGDGREARRILLGRRPARLVRRPRLALGPRLHDARVAAPPAASTTRSTAATSCPASVCRSASGSTGPSRKGPRPRSSRSRCRPGGRREQGRSRGTGSPARHPLPRKLVVPRESSRRSVAAEYARSASSDPRSRSAGRRAPEVLLAIRN